MPDEASDVNARFQKTIEHIAADIATLRTGRASSQILDPVVVEAYGGKMKINEVANVAAPDPTLLVITPWDKSLMGAIEKAVQISGLNLQPIIAGDIIRIPVPALTEERRKEMVKLLQQKIESGKVMLRNVRSEAKREIEDLKGDAGVSEDDITREVEELEKDFQTFIDKIDAMAKDKEKDLMSI
jgi:ribosome recycling factor